MHIIFFIFCFRFFNCTASICYFCLLVGCECIEFCFSTDVHYAFLNIPGKLFAALYDSMCFYPALPFSAICPQGSLWECTRPVRDNVTMCCLSFIGWVHTQNDPCVLCIFICIAILTYTWMYVNPSAFVPEGLLPSLLCMPCHIRLYIGVYMLLCRAQDSMCVV